MTENHAEEPSSARSQDTRSQDISAQDISAQDAWPLLDGVLLHTRVERVEMLARRTRRIELVGTDLADLAWTPGQNVSVFLADPATLAQRQEVPRDLRRSYSVWDYDCRGRLEIAVYDHGGGEGPGAAWARQVGPGDAAVVTRPEGRLMVRSDPGLHLFVGEDTAAVSFGAMLRALPVSTPVRGVIECDEEDDRLPLPRAADLTWVHRRGASAAQSRLVTSTLAALDLSGEELGAAYVVGEVRTCQAVRRHLLEERGWPRQKVLVRAFWTPGRTGMD